MLNKIRNKIERTINKYTRNLGRVFALRKISPVLFESIKGFLCRKGKRIRPILFILGYSGFTKRRPRNLYTCSLSVELLHNFMLIHDDIIDKSDLRRGLPSMHRILQARLKDYKNTKFNGQDLAIVIGDVIYAMAINSFLSIEESPRRKEKALKNFTEAAIYTGSGEFAELLYGASDIKKITKADIYRIYDLKTSYYTFCSPLAVGATLAGANIKEIGKLIRYGIYLGRAFQIKDDILDMFGKEEEIGKSPLTDLKEGKKTLLLWHAYKTASSKNKRAVEKALGKNTLKYKDLIRIRRIVSENGSLEYAKAEISRFLKQANKICASLKMRPQYKKLLRVFSEQILDINYF